MSGYVEVGQDYVKHFKEFEWDLPRVLYSIGVAIGFGAGYMFAGRYPDRMEVLGARIFLSLPVVLILVYVVLMLQT